MAMSYNGWSAEPDLYAIGVRPFSPIGDYQFPQGVKQGDVATVMAYLCLALHTRVESIGVGYGCWGAYFRANVNNPSVLSCHASGTAIDWRAPEHPNGVAYTWTTEQAAEIRKILFELRGVVRWLEGYDEMHFEIKGTVSAVAIVASAINNGTLNTAIPPGEIMATTTEIQHMLNVSEGQIASAIRAAITGAVAELKATQQRILDESEAQIAGAVRGTVAVAVGQVLESTHVARRAKKANDTQQWLFAPGVARKITPDALAGYAALGIIDTGVVVLPDSQINALIAAAG